MNLPQDLRSLSWTARRAKGKAQMAKNKVKRAEHQIKKVKGHGGRSERSTPEPTSESTAAPTSRSVPDSTAVSDSASGSDSVPMSEWVTQSTSGVEPDRGSKPSAFLPAVVGVLGAIGAALLSWPMADNSDDRVVLVMIGLPLGAILAVGVVVGYRWAGLIER